MEIKNLTTTSLRQQMHTVLTGTGEYRVTNEYVPVPVGTVPEQGIKRSKYFFTLDIVSAKINRIL
jgi:hypothetical protein